MAKRNVDIFLNAHNRYSKNYKGLNKANNGLKRDLKAIAGAVAGAFAIGKIKSFISSVIESGDQIGKASKRIGITAEEYQKYAFAARRAGASNELFEKGIRRLQKNINDAERGLSTANDSFSELGLTFDELKGKDPAQQFNIVANALELVEDKSKKAALAQDVFGRAGVQLIPMLRNYRELGMEAEKTGLIMSNDAVKGAEDFKDSIENLTTALKSLTGTTLIPWIADVTTGLEQIITNKKLPFLRNMFESIQELITGEQASLPSSLMTAPNKRKVRREGRQQRSRERREKEKQQARNEQLKAAQLAAQEAAADEKKKAAIKSVLDSMKMQVTNQRLIASGLEKEAYILDRIERARKQINGELEKSQENEIRNLAGQRFDLLNQRKPQIEPGKEPFNGASALSVTSQRGISGLGSAIRPMEENVKQVKQTNNILEQIQAGLIELPNLINNSLQGAFQNNGTLEI